MSVEKVAVIGAGVMGAGIAAHLANAGVDVRLLDIVPEGANDRSVVAKTALERLGKAEPAAFMHKRNARRVTPGNIEDDLESIGDCDWIIEAVVERLDVKRSLYARIDAVRKPGAIVSSNTSTIPLEKLVEGASDAFRGDFLIAHFFNPPRYMRLLELVVGAETSARASETITAFADRALGKGVVRCNDRPGFIANRIGTYWIQCAMSAAMELGLTVEEADAIAGTPMGVPKTGVFGLVDLVGIDLMPHILGSLVDNLDADDPLVRGAGLPQVVLDMIDRGLTGRKGDGGFYRLRREGGKRVKEAIDLTTGEYRTAVKARPAAARAKGLRALAEHDSDGGRFAKDVLVKVLGYAASLVPEIAATPAELDAGMRLGYSWKRGPFELIDELGADWLADELVAAGLAVPPLLASAREAGGFYRNEGGRLQCLHPDATWQAIERPEGVLLLADVKRAGKPVAANRSASLWDLGDGVACLELHAMRDAIDAGLLGMMDRAVDIVAERFEALVIHSERDNFSVGANVGVLLFAANMAAFEQIDQMVAGGQAVMRKLRTAPFPVVGAPAGMALGGGCEILLHCDAVQAHAETYMGLVEVGVGLIPGWGGCRQLLGRWIANPRRPGGPMPPIAKAFETISTATVSRSAAQAKDLLFLNPDDGITMNRDRLLADAKARAKAMVDGYAPPEPEVFRLPGPTARTAMNLAVSGFHRAGRATDHDVVVGDALAGVLSGGETDLLDELDEDALYRLERQAFVGLARTEPTLARVEHMLETGKPLRN